MQVLRHARRAVPRQIVRRGDDDAARLAELARGQRAVGQRPEPDRHIRLARGDVHHRVGQRDIDEDVRIERANSPSSGTTQSRPCASAALTLSRPRGAP